MGRNHELEHLQLRIQWAGRQAAAALEPLLPFVAQAAVSMGAYAVGLAAAQGLGSALRISCATPVAGPLGGLLGVGFASALAGQASLKAQRVRAEGLGRGLLDPGALFRGVRRQDLIADAVLGIAAFRVMGGRFRSVMPSDLTKVGALARESMPAAGMQYATDEKRRELARFFRRDGCHHCGTRHGPVVGDHMPPNKHVAEAADAARRRRTLWGWIPALQRSKAARRVAGAMGVPLSPPLQRYYPQCRPCSQKQAAAVRNNRSHLVLHEVLHRGGTSTAWHYAGVLVGLRHYSGSDSASSGGGGGGTTGLRRYGLTRG